MTRRARAIGTVAGAGIVAAVVAGGLAVGTSAPAALVAPTTTASTGVVRIERVVDGDTFVVAGGDRVRVLGINACEKGTAGGAAATARARALLEGRSVTLRAEPGHDRDVYRRALRYVQLPDGRDFSEVMVPARDVEVYRGRNDAERGYVARLRAIDGPARVC